MAEYLGVFNQFCWHNRLVDIRQHVVYKLKNIDFIVNGTSTAELVDIATGATSALIATPITYDLDGDSLTRTRISGTLAANKRYYIVIDGIYYSDVIEKSDCGIDISATNLCNDTYYGWKDDAFPVTVLMPDAIVDTKTTEFEKEISISETGKKERVKSLIIKHSVAFIGPSDYASMLNAFSANEVIEIGGIAVKNMTVSAEPLSDGEYSKITITYEYIELVKKSGCCEELNIDEIILNGQGGAPSVACTGFIVTITNASGTLTAASSGGTVSGTTIYRWYRNGQYISSGSTVVTNGVFGEYRVEASNTGCIARNSLYIGDPCSSMRVEAYVTGNDINADIINNISGSTISVKLNGAQVSTSLPYTATTTGTYYIYVTKDNCTRSDSVFVDVAVNNCAYTVSINKVGNVLQAVTNAVSPFTYKWELETSTGRVVIGTSVNQTLQGNGIYWLTVEKGLCAKESHYYQYVNANKVVNFITKANGYQFSTYDINLATVDPTRLNVRINNVPQVYQSTTPGSTGFYTISGGQIVTWSAAPYTNATIYIDYE